VTAPTGDKKKGFSIGHATWNQTNHFDMPSRFLTFLDAESQQSWIQSFFNRPLLRMATSAINGVSNTIRESLVFGRGLRRRALGKSDGDQPSVSLRLGEVQLHGPQKNRKSYYFQRFHGRADFSSRQRYNAGIDTNLSATWISNSILAAVFRCNSTATRSESA